MKTFKPKLYNFPFEIEINTMVDSFGDEHIQYRFLLDGHIRYVYSLFRHHVHYHNEPYIAENIYSLEEAIDFIYYDHKRRSKTVDI
jgi:hypothetical protein